VTLLVTTSDPINLKTVCVVVCASRVTKCGMLSHSSQATRYCSSGLAVVYIGMTARRDVVPIDTGLCTPLLTSYTFSQFVKVMLVEARRWFWLDGRSGAVGQCDGAAPCQLANTWLRPRFHSLRILRGQLAHGRATLAYCNSWEIVEERCFNQSCPFWAGRHTSRSLPAGMPSFQFRPHFPHTPHLPKLWMTDLLHVNI